jgi:hypothetical protein
VEEQYGNASGHRARQGILQVDLQLSEQEAYVTLQRQSRATPQIDERNRGSDCS